jgi:SAM-dependent methyltransferase
MACLTAEQLAELPAKTKVLELGCGPQKLWANSVAIDINPRSKADVIHDLNKFPYPFPDNEFDMVIGEHVLEHLDDVIKTMEEIHRVTRPGGMVFIEVPHYTSSDFFTDPTHKHSFSSRSFDYFVPATGGVYLFHYSKCDFAKRKCELSGNDRSWWRRWINGFANRHQVGFERDMAFWFPRQHINFELEVLKNREAR